MGDEGAGPSRLALCCMNGSRRCCLQAGLPDPSRMGAETAFQAYDRAYLRSREMAGAVLADLRRYSIQSTGTPFPRQWVREWRGIVRKMSGQRKLFLQSLYSVRAYLQECSVVCSAFV